MYHIDEAYLMKLSGQLPLFKRYDAHLYKCRCVICGDSKKSKIKTRMFFYKFKDKMLVKCHNCSVCMTFGSFLKEQNRSLYDEYMVEKFIEAGQSYSIKKVEDMTAKKNIPDVFQLGYFMSGEIWSGKLLEPITSLSADHTARTYVEGRMIPGERWNELYYAHRFRSFMDCKIPWHGKEIPEDERLVWFCTDLNGNPSQVCARALDPNTEKRYLKIRLHKEETGLRRCFGINRFDKLLDHTIYVVEGEIDSLFLKGAIASGDAALQNLAEALAVKFQGSEIKIVVVFDNEPRNKEICKAMAKAIKAGHNIVVWPSSLKEKDINDMVKAGYEPKKIIDSHTYAGLDAEWQFGNWKQC